MGIPKFFRWMSERYPGLMVTAKENQLPEIDNFYLDMNGIIHNCSHPNDGDVHFRISENEMFEDIFNYISTLFDIIKPREYFFLAVDGVAPRAKMNQQRGRRFRSAKEAFDREEAAMKKGDVLPTEERFDSNCITPGTEFMVKLNETLKQFIKMKLSTDPEWQKVKVILSGHETPGEGEHKVMDFIRYTRSQPGYNAETRHCLYGLDTDLIMLGLSSHEPNFMLLREEIKFNSKKNDATKGKSNRVDPSKINFNVLYLSLLRDYIKQDFLPLKSKLTFKFDLEAIIDDWILICFLVGNDFIPHIPHFHIHKNALPKILEVYQATLLKTDGYLNEKGILNLKRFKVFARIMSQLDFENYKMLVKQNGGECAKDDFSKLNEFVRVKMRIHGIRRDNYNNSHNNGHNNNYNNNYTNNRAQRPNGRPENFSHHSHFQQSNVWYNIQRSGNAVNNNSNSPNGKLNGSFNHTPVRPNHTSSASKVQSYNGKPTNGTPNARVGVHSFTEEQINNSITVCADGDFIDLSDEEYLSDEKFPGERGQMKQRLKNGPMTRRSTPKKDHSDRKDLVKVRPSSEFDDFKAYKRTYYREKFKINPDRESVLTVVSEYVRALQWNLHYYYHGCVSWGWFYPYHYAPFISDILNFKTVDVHFEMGEPFKPYDQLLSVLPAASSSLLPKMYRSLVTSSDSPLAQFFPTEVEYDLNGKQNDWEAVVLAPFIDEQALLKATVVCNLFLSSEERAINAHGPHLLFQYVPGHRGGQVKCQAIPSNGFNLPRDKIKYGLLMDDMAAIKPSQNTTTTSNNNNTTTTRAYRPYQRK
uniref:5'-3' exoribonuclease n=1 Tax=Aceria tosichella TaxID=561515 RepID=A0A6G1SN29_9ACAR